MSIPDHIVIIVEENHDADQVFANSFAPYINGTLAANGLVYTNAHGTDHPSQPNYLEMFAGTNPGVQGVNSPLQQNYPVGMENTPAGQNALAHGDDYNDQPFSIPNLGAELLASGRTFAGYSEDLPSVGFTGAQANGRQGIASYVEKHNPWAQFQGTGPNQLPASTNQPFTTFQSLNGNFAALPTISFVVPDQYNDMHNTVSSIGLPAINGTGMDSHGNPVNGDSTVQNGDNWLRNNIEAYRQWATNHNSLLITVWDENDYDFADANNIPMIIDGDPHLVQHGVNSLPVNHFDLLRTLESYYGLELTGAATGANGLFINSFGQLLANSETPTYGFNADSRSDVLWRNNAGLFSEWQSNGNGFIPNVYLNGTVDTSWAIAGIADFNGDGQSDILWRQSGGLFTEWQSTGNAFMPNAYVDGTVNIGWRVAGVADFDGDGRSDILWRNASGLFTEWQSTGNEFTQNVYVDGSVGPVWQVVATADFNGDGRSDILWRNTNSGTFTEWRSTGNGFTPNVCVDGTVDTSWEVAGTGDFNHDGRSDILWRNSSGLFTEWQSTGNGFTQNVYVDGSVDPSWQIASVADFNGDHSADIMWRNSSLHTTTVWSSTGNGFTPNTFVDSSVSASWSVQAPH
jgi:hypothetical protein